MNKASNGNTASVDKLFLEIKDKCAVLGISVSKEGFLTYLDKYIALAKKYDDAAERFLFLKNKRHRQLSKELVEKDGIPEFVAFIKAKQILIEEFNEQVACQVIKVADDNEIKELAELEEKKVTQRKEEEQRREAIRQTWLKAEEQKKEALEKARLKANEKLEKTQERARLKAKEQQKEALEKARLKANEHYREVQAKREAEKKQKARHEAQKQKRKERLAKFTAKWDKSKNTMISLSATMQTAGHSFARWKNLVNNKVNVFVTDTQAYKKKAIELAKEKYKLNTQDLKKKSIKTLKVATMTVPFVVGSYYLADKISFNNLLNPVRTSINVNPKGALSSQQQEEQEWAWESSSNRDIDDTALLNDTLSYGVLATSPNMPLFSKCFDECNRRLGEQAGYGITSKMIADFKSKNPAMARRYAGFLWHNDNLVYERIIAKAQVFDKYDIASFHNPDIASYMYNLVLQQNNDSTVHRVQALADGIKDFYDICGKELSDNQEQALNHLSDFNAETVDVHDWRQVIATVNNMIDPAEEKALFEHIKTSVADAYVSFVVPNTTEYVEEKNSELKEEKKLYAYTPVMGGDTYQADSINVNDYLPSSDVLGDLMFNFADHDFAAVMQRPIPLTTYEEQANARLKADMATFKRLHLQAYHDMYIKMQYGMKYSAFSEVNQVLRKHGKKGLVERYFCAGTSIACLCIASDKMKEIDPDNYVSKAIDNIVNHLSNPHYCNTLQQDLHHLASKTLGREAASKLYNASSSNLRRECSQKMGANPDGFMYVWTVRYQNSSTGETKYHHQACLPPLYTEFCYTYASFNGNHWDTNNAKFNWNLSGRTFNMGEFVYELAEQYKNHDIENYMQKNALADNIMISSPENPMDVFFFAGDIKNNIR